MLTIRDLRRAQKIRPEFLALQLEVSLATIYNWESGRSEPTLSQARTLASIFAVSLDDFYAAYPREVTDDRSLS